MVVIYLLGAPPADALCLAAKLLPLQYERCWFLQADGAANTACWVQLTPIRCAQSAKQWRLLISARQMYLPALLAAHLAAQVPHFYCDAAFCDFAHVEAHLQTMGQHNMACHAAS
jgi:hypothetical protein